MCSATPVQKKICPKRRILSGESRAALAVMASVSGVGFASGQEIALFFSQLGPAAWPGMILASLLFTLLLRGFMSFSRKTGADSLPGVFRRMYGPASARMIIALYGFLTALVSIMMLKTCGEIGALTLPVKHGYLTGMLAALLSAIVICTGRTCCLPALGLLAVISTALLYALLALDPRPADIHIRTETVLRLSGSVKAAMALAMLHASLNVSVASDAAAAFSGGNANPGKASRIAGRMMLACLLLGHTALLRGGSALYAQALPNVLLASRWGAAGFWISAGHMYLLSVCSLSASLGALIALIGKRP